MAIPIYRQGLMRLHSVIKWGSSIQNHRLGLIKGRSHTCSRRQSIEGIQQQSIKYGDVNRYSRVAHRRLLRGPNPDAAPDGRTLPQVCLNAIEGLSPSVMQSQLNDHGSFPEAAFQDEIYRCLYRELHHLPILSEYSHSRNGRIDFYIFDKKWGIEILQSGSKAQLMEHAARFGPGGKYKAWNILDDYIVLSFCPKSKVRNMEIQGKFHSFRLACLWLTLSPTGLQTASSNPISCRLQ